MPPLTNAVVAETPRSVKLVEVIETVTIKGNGVSSPVREVIQYWSKEGKLLGEIDPCNEGEAK